MANTFLEDRVLRALDNLSALNTLANPQEPNYWEKLKHQAAISVMQGMLSNPSITERESMTRRGIIEDAEWIATALVEKLKSGNKI